MNKNMTYSSTSERLFLLLQSSSNYCIFVGVPFGEIEMCSLIINLRTPKNPTRQTWRTYGERDIGRRTGSTTLGALL